MCRKKQELVATYALDEFDTPEEEKPAKKKQKVEK